MDGAWTIIIAILSSGAFSVLINRFFDWLDKRKGKKDVNTKATMFCLLYTLQQFGKELTSKGTITRAEYRQFESMFKTYKEIGGDGFADLIKAEVDRLHVVY